jgi:hypothetical protein
MKTVLSLLLLLPSLALADDERDVTYLLVTEIDIDDPTEVNGILVKPQLSPLTGTPRGQFAPMILLRQNFDVELQASVDEVK